MRGRKPKPKEMKMLEGTYRPDRDTGGLQVTGLDKLPAAPSWFTEEAMKIYETVGKTLHGLKMLNELNLQHFVIYCYMMGVYVSYLKKHPGDSVLESSDEGGRQFRKAMRFYESAYKIGSDFGLNPAMQQRLTGFNKRDERNDPFQIFLKS